MAQTAIAPNVHQALDIHRDFPAQIALDAHFLVDDVTNAVDFVVSQVTHSCIRVDIGALEKLLARMQPNPEDVRQRRLNTLFAREIDSRNSRHVLSPLNPQKCGLLALSLLVPWVDANHPHHSLASNDFALLAAPSYRSCYLHVRYQSCHDRETPSVPEICAYDFKNAHTDSARPWRAPNTLF